jgi:hypothetical protein
MYVWTLKVMDSNEQLIMEKELRQEFPPSVEWNTMEYAFRFKEEYADKMDQVRYLVFVHDGKDNQFWKGHYGTKFARACVRFRFCDGSTVEEESDKKSNSSSGSSSGSDSQNGLNRRVRI